MCPLHDGSSLFFPFAVGVRALTPLAADWFRGVPLLAAPPLCSSSLSPSCAPPSLPATSLPRCSWLCSAPPADCSACYSAPLFLSPSGSAAHTAVCSYLSSLSHPPPIEIGRQWCVSRQRCCHDSMGWRQLEIESGPPA